VSGERGKFKSRQTTPGLLDGSKWFIDDGPKLSGWGAAITSRRIGIVLVHGIGSQRSGATLEKFIEGLQALARCPVTIISREPRRAIINVADSSVHVYESWWADILSGENVRGSFDPLMVNSIAWFPWLNLRFGCYPNRPVVRTVLWTVLLSPVMAGVQILFRPLFELVGRAPKLFDEVVADATNYAESAAGAARHAQYGLAAEQILDRVGSALEQAASECDQIVVIGHSLGSVIAYHAISGRLAQIPGRNFSSRVPSQALGKITTLITIGSPLEKIRWVYPMLVAPDYRGTVTHRPYWINMRDRLDPVAGKIRHAKEFGAVQDSAVVGRAWLFNAHTAYVQNPKFFRLLFERIGLKKVPVARVSPAVRAMLLAKSLTLTLGAFLACLTLLAIWAGIVAGLVTGGLWIVSEIFNIKNAQGTAQFNAENATNVPADPIGLGVFWAIALVVGLILPLAYGRYRAAPLHYAFRRQHWPDSVTEETGEAHQSTPDEEKFFKRHPILRLTAVAMLIVIAIGAFFSLSYVTGIFGLNAANSVSVHPMAPMRYWPPALGSIGTTLLGMFTVAILGCVMGFVVGGCVQLILKYRRWDRRMSGPPTMQPKKERDSHPPD
jgi:hypothetical protein